MQCSLSAVLVCCCLLTVCLASVDLYISKQEMNRTLGTSSSVRYIDDGLINQYALTFPYMVRHNITHVKFWWINRADTQVTYSMRSISSNPSAVFTSLNIPRVGLIPHNTHEFLVVLQCTKVESGLFPVTLYLNYTNTEHGDTTRVQIQMKKHCLNGIISQDDQVEGTVQAPQTSWNDVANEATMSAGQVFYVSIIAVCLFVLMIAGMIVLYFLRTKHISDASSYAIGAAGDSPYGHIISPQRLQQLEPFLKSTSINQTVFEKKYATYDERKLTQQLLHDRKPHPSLVNQDRASNVSSALYSVVRSVKSELPPIHTLPFATQPVDISMGLRSLAVDLQEDLESIQIHETQLEGTFGRLQLGVWQERSADSSNEPDEQGILLKRLKHNVSNQQKNAFCRDCLLYFNLPPHAHISQAIAVFTLEDKDNKTIVHPLIQSVPVPDRLAFCYAHDGFGNLKSFLLKQSTRTLGGKSPNAPKNLGTHDMVELAVQAVTGVLHLHAHRILHTDIAARNCVLVASDLTHDYRIQLCDAALSRDLYPNDYDCIGDNENRPIKWMAPESILQAAFTPASDLWSFGVLMWELFTFGQQPYIELEADDLARCLFDGYRLPQPYNCPDELYGVVFCCWAHDPVNRPTFNQLHAALNAFHTQLTQYI